MTQKVYISGPISGMPDKNRQAFAEAAQMLRGQGYEPVNPHEVCAGLDHDTAEWIDYMRLDIKALVDCDYIYMLPRWHNSKGAHAEFLIAKELGIMIF